MRAYWDGKQFLSRQGNRFFAPDWFISGLPTIPLDGELWVGRKRFQTTVGIVRRQDAGRAWKNVKYVVFDAPDTDRPFEERRREIGRAVHADRCPYVCVLDQTPCGGIDHMQRELARIEALGGEGLMLRQPGSRYQAGRSHTLLKVKRFHDAEGRVVEHLPGSGRHRGRLGALLVETIGGVRFSVGTGLTDAQRETPPVIGSVITYRFQELTDGGVPRFPSFVRVRAGASHAPPRLF